MIRREMATQNDAGFRCTRNSPRNPHLILDQVSFHDQVESSKGQVETDNHSQNEPQETDNENSHSRESIQALNTTSDSQYQSLNRSVNDQSLNQSVTNQSLNQSVNDQLPYQSSVRQSSNQSLIEHPSLNQSLIDQSPYQSSVRQSLCPVVVISHSLCSLPDADDPDENQSRKISQSVTDVTHLNDRSVSHDRLSVTGRQSSEPNSSLLNISNTDVTYTHSIGQFQVITLNFRIFYSQNSVFLLFDVVLGCFMLDNILLVNIINAKHNFLFRFAG